MVSPRPIRCSSSEQGFILLIALFLLALLVISLSVTVPQISKEIQRDREVETMQRGKQYIRAIQLYYRKFGAYPPSIDALVKTDNIRFLRKRYFDPMTGKDDWKPIHWGQNKTPTAMGFFGQPLAGTTLGGVGPSGGNGLAGPSATGSSTAAGGLSSGSSQFSSTDTSTTSTSPSDASSSAAASGATGATGSTAAGGIANPSASSSSTSGIGLSGQTFGGAGIIGFSPGRPNQSILVYKKKNHYNEWEFTYDPLQDQMTMQGGSAGNTGINGQPAGSSTPGFGNTTGSGAGSNSTTTPTPPQ